MLRVRVAVANVATRAPSLSYTPRVASITQYECVPSWLTSSLWNASLRSLASSATNRLNIKNNNNASSPSPSSAGSLATVTSARSSIGRSRKKDNDNSELVDHESSGSGGSSLQFVNHPRPTPPLDPSVIDYKDVDQYEVPSDFDDDPEEILALSDSDLEKWAIQQGLPPVEEYAEELRQRKAKRLEIQAAHGTYIDPSPPPILSLTMAKEAAAKALQVGVEKRKATLDELDDMLVIEDSKGHALDITDSTHDVDVKNLLRGLAAEVVTPLAPAVNPDDALRQLPSSLEDWFAHRPVNVANYNKLLRVHSAKFELDAGLKTFAHMKAAGIVPNLFTYHALISLHGCRPSDNPAVNKQNADRALQILNEDLKTADLLPNEYTYGCMIATLGQLGDHKRAFELLPQMISQGVVPNTAIYSMLISAALKSNLLDKANSTFEKMSQHGVVPNLLTYNTMIQVAALQGEAERAISFLEMAKNERMKPNYATYHSVMSACVRRDDYYKDAFVYFTEMVKSGLLPNQDTFTVLLYGASRRHDLETGMSLLREMKKYGVVHNERTLTAWIGVIRSTMHLHNSHVETRVLDQKARIRLAEEALLQMEAKNMPIGSRTLNGIVAVYARAVWVKTTLNRMKDLFTKYNFTPDLQTYTILLTMFCRNRAIDRALSILQEMKDKGFKPPQSSYETILLACRKRRDRPNGSKILAEMRSLHMEVPQEYVDIFDDFKWDPLNPPKELAPLGATKQLLGRTGARRAAANRTWDPRIDHPHGVEDDYQPDFSEWTKDVGVRKPRPKSVKEQTRDDDRKYQRSMNIVARQDLFGEAQNNQGEWEQRLLGRGTGDDMTAYIRPQDRPGAPAIGRPRLDMRGKSPHRLDVRTGGSLKRQERAEDRYEAQHAIRARPQYEVNEGQKPKVGRYGGVLPKRSPRPPGKGKTERTKHGNRKHKK